MVEKSTQTDDNDSATFLKGIEEIEARQALRIEIIGLTKPYQLGHEEPPFDVRDLIVFALILSAKETLSEHEIHRWIIKTFPYFNLQAIDYYIQSVAYIDKQRTCNNPNKEIVKGFQNALTHFDLPLEEHFNHNCDEWRYSIKTGAARIFLARWLEPERKGQFPFLKLAPELRNRIYEMLFKYPAPGILVGRLDGPYLLSSVVEWIGPKFEDARLINMERPSETLAILRTCKQVRDEASPMFCGLNNFFLEGSHFTMDADLRQLPLSRAKFLKNIHIKLDHLWREGKHFEDLFDSLSKLSLDKLTLCMSRDIEIHWLLAFGTSGKGLWTENKFYKRRLWIMVGAVMKAKKFEVRGNCSAFKAFMSSKVRMEDADADGEEKPRGS
ncbi:hypothetical protein AC578_7739 [Pseudocercospora eumusae]|uniref:Fork-head domain-containing protein n=1 Tax=Pseudocercospora eumusae TaxID=321146 RepID=A0A139HKY6_9PEZI|nr:hypothetical protein AC578_7739 [Pseudocercospora eumusae]